MSLIRTKEQTHNNQSLEDYYTWLSGFQPLMANTMLSILNAINDLLQDRTVYCHTSHEAIVLQSGPELNGSNHIIRIQCQPENCAELMVCDCTASKESLSRMVGQNLTVQECLNIVAQYISTM